MNDRDFKGIWIPKEIWLSKELTMLEKAIYVEIDSLDNETHCIAGNEYFAEFCGCSISKVTKAIKKLQDLEMIEVMSFDGRHRQIRVVKSTRQSSKKYEADSQKVRANNIDSNIVNNKTNSKELVENFQFGSKTQKKESLYTKCISLVDTYTTDKEMRTALIDYLRVRLEMKDVPLYANSWKGLLNKLDRDFDASERLAVVRQSIERGYKSFFPVNSYNRKNDKFAEVNVVSEAYTDEELRELERLDEERKRNGLRTKF